ncbi:MAG: hypothetical protein ABI781_10455, partial [Burkholderiales bacterium]
DCQHFEQVSGGVAMSDRVKPSRMLVRLDAEMAAARSPLEADCKRVELASYLARLGQIGQARSELEEMRRKYALSPNVVMSAWLNLVEGVIGHFDNMDPAARNKILRAHALSSAANLSRVRALTSAWLAHMDYLQVDFASMARHAAEALRLSVDDEHSVRSRVSLVIAQSYHLAGRLDLALPWYGLARSHAAADGDDATLSALMHNMAWLRAQRLRAADCGLALEPTRIERHALLGADSTANFDSLIGSKSLRALVPILRAQILTVRKQYSEALGIFEVELQAAVRDGMGRLEADLLADQAWCRLQCGQRESALRDALLAETSINPTGHFDDRALAYGRLAQTFDALNQFDRAERTRRLAAVAWSGHVILQAEIVQILAPLVQPITP